MCFTLLIHMYIIHYKYNSLKAISKFHISETIVCFYYEFIVTIYLVIKFFQVLSNEIYFLKMEFALKNLKG